MTEEVLLSREAFLLLLGDAIAARTALALNRISLDLYPIDDELNAAHEMTSGYDFACLVAHDIGFRHGDNRALRDFLAGERLLHEAWCDGVEMRVVLDEQAQRERIEAEKSKQIEAKIRAGDWRSLGLPTPPELAAQLQRARPAPQIHGHTLFWDAEDGVVWFTNPYGQDGILARRPDDLPVLTGFLANMARGVEYGRVPY